jgi:hypothetical protein
MREPEKMHHKPCSIYTLIIISLIACLSGLPSANAETPESPRVQALLNNAAAFLEKEKGRDGNFGGNALVTYALLKHARMRAKDSMGSARCQSMCNEVIGEIRAALKANKSDPGGPWARMYSPCIALMFLCELDSQKYAAEIKEILQFVYDRQRSDGSFGYLTVELNPDISQTQYAALAYWYAKQKGFEVPQQRGKAILSFMVKGQSPDGGYVYHVGKRGEENTMSMIAAGMSAVYITGDWLGIADAGGNNPKRKKRQSDNGLPLTVTLARDDTNIDFSEGGESVVVTNLDQCKAKGNAWFNSHHTYDLNRMDIMSQRWILYYMYGVERYQAFYAKANGFDDDEPKWYNDGVDYLEKAVSADGGWKGPIAYENRSIATSFAMLFLMRNSRATIKELEDGALTGTEGVPGGKLTLIGGKIVATQDTRDVEDLMTMANKAETQDWDAFRSTLKDLKLSEDPVERNRQLSGLRMLVDHKQFEARVIAVTQLGKLRDFDCVPNLIYALGDPDIQVREAAHKALRVLSRQFDIPNPPENAGDEHYERLKRTWKKWYLTIQPDAVFLD